MLQADTEEEIAETVNPAIKQVNSVMPDQVRHDGQNIRVRGTAKVMMHLIFGIIVIAANQLFHLFT